MNGELVFWVHYWSIMGWQTGILVHYRSIIEWQTGILVHYRSIIEWQTGILVHYRSIIVTNWYFGILQVNYCDKLVFWYITGQLLSGKLVFWYITGQLLSGKLVFWYITGQLLWQTDILVALQVNYWVTNWYFGHVTARPNQMRKWYIHVTGSLIYKIIM